MIIKIFINQSIKLKTVYIIYFFKVESNNVTIIIDYINKRSTKGQLI